LQKTRCIGNDIIARLLLLFRSPVFFAITCNQSQLVEVNLRPTPSRALGAGNSISLTFGVEAYVVPVSSVASDAERLDQVAMTTARIITGWFHSDMVLAVAWGTTLSAVAKHLNNKPTREAQSFNLTVQQIFAPLAGTTSEG